ncbi:hypothetical protein NQZ68_034880 [Dissostichus eleginoides]|nr:hypothetical protein NQZ68_034880 [Dissostichus eleginoides]
MFQYMAFHQTALSDHHFTTKKQLCGSQWSSETDRIQAVSVQRPGAAEGVPMTGEGGICMKDVALLSREHQQTTLSAHRHPPGSSEMFFLSQPVHDLLSSGSEGNLSLLLARGLTRACMPPKHIFCIKQQPDSTKD